MSEHGLLGFRCRVEPIIMSAGELEHEWAGTPGRMIRCCTCCVDTRVHGTHCATSARCTQQPSIRIPNIRGALQHVTQASHVRNMQGTFVTQLLPHVALYTSRM
jgi:hypothetical protein